MSTATPNDCEPEFRLAHADLLAAPPSRFSVTYAKVSNGHPLQLKPLQRRNLAFHDGVLSISSHAVRLINARTHERVATSSVAPPQPHPLFEWLMLTFAPSRSIGASVLMQVASNGRVAAEPSAGAVCVPPILAAISGATSGGRSSSSAEAVAAINAVGEQAPELVVGAAYLVQVGAAIDIPIRDLLPHVPNPAAANGPDNSSSGAAAAPTRPRAGTARGTTLHAHAALTSAAPSFPLHHHGYPVGACFTQQQQQQQQQQPQQACFPPPQLPPRQLTARDYEAMLSAVRTRAVADDTTYNPALPHVFTHAAQQPAVGLISPSYDRPVGAPDAPIRSPATLGRLEVDCQNEAMSPTTFVRIHFGVTVPEAMDLFFGPHAWAPSSAPVDVFI
jgi:hypothetical protein